MEKFFLPFTDIPFFCKSNDVRFCMLKFRHCYYFLCKQVGYFFAQFFAVKVLTISSRATQTGGLRVCRIAKSLRMHGSPDSFQICDNKMFHIVIFFIKMLGWVEEPCLLTFGSMTHPRGAFFATKPFSNKRKLDLD